MTTIQLTHRTAIHYVAGKLCEMCTGDFRILGAREAGDNHVVVSFQESNSGEHVQCFDVWVKDLGNGPFVYGEW